MCQRLVWKGRPWTWQTLLRVLLWKHACFLSRLIFNVMEWVSPCEMCDFQAPSSNASGMVCSDLGNSGDLFLIRGERTEPQNKAKTTAKHGTWSNSVFLIFFELYVWRTCQFWASFPVIKTTITIYLPDIHTSHPWSLSLHMHPFYIYVKSVPSISIYINIHLQSFHTNLHPYMAVSWNRSTPSPHPFLDGIFTYEPSSYWGTPMAMEPLYLPNY